MEPLNAVLKGVIIRTVNGPRMNKCWIMKAKFSAGIFPASDLKVNPGKIIRQTQEAHRFMRGVLKGVVDLEEGREQALRMSNNI